ncbi:MAG: 2-C-methyl-D-erythritol 4-phosphate cytidylyltransferase [Formivibrio sp.]|nr:2-C-methyl-D-erythritol 4-phosphate cytidylyltransferase [Formivibrio sp.]
MNCFALVPAAGSGARMGAATPKQYLDLLGKPLIWHTLHALSAVPEIARICVVISAGDEWWDSYDWSAFDRLQVLRCGGTSRAESVLNGLQAAEVDDADWALVHDAARPCLDPHMVSAMIAELQDDAVGGILAVPVADTLKRAGVCDRIACTESRDGLWQAQTPQMFRRGALIDAIAAYIGPDITDEASALEKQGHSPQLVMGSPWNIKVTYPQDLKLAALILHGAVVNG